MVQRLPPTFVAAVGRRPELQQTVHSQHVVEAGRPL
jgi:hypothetical protein